jgi:preprotein translocase subunit YajC
MTAVLSVLAAAQKTTNANPLVSLLPILLIGVVFYFLLIRPQQRRARSQRELTQSVEEGDEVVTIGGIFGIVRELEDDSVLLEVAPGTELRFLRSAIARKLTPEDEREFQSTADDRSSTDDDAEEHDHPAGDTGFPAPDEEFGQGEGAGEKK